MAVSFKSVLFVFLLGILLYWYPAYLLGFADTDLEGFQGIPWTYKVIRIIWVSAFGCFFLFNTLIKGGTLGCNKISNDFVKILFCYLMVNAIVITIHFETIYKLSSTFISSFSWFIIIFMFLSLKRPSRQITLEGVYSALQLFAIIQIVAVVYHIFWGPAAPHDHGFLKRSVGTLGEPSAFGIFSVLVTLMFFSKIILNKESAFIKVFCIACLLLILASVSISAIIGFFVGAVYLTIIYGNINKKIILTTIVIMVAIPVAFFLDYLSENIFFVQYILLKTTRILEGSAPSRFEIGDSLNYLLNHMNIMDFLIGDFSGYAPAPENYYLYTFFKSGIIVTVLLLIIIAVSIRHGHYMAMKFRKAKQYKICAYYAGLTSFIIAILISNMAIPTLHIFVGSIIIWTAILLLWFSNFEYMSMASGSIHEKNERTYRCSTYEDQ